MVILPGPVKVELGFPSEPQEPEPAWVVAAENLPAIDCQFWDWALWASGKEAAGKNDLVTTELQMLFEHLLAPLGGEQTPDSVSDAVAVYRCLRQAAEERIGVNVSRRLENEVAALLDNADHRL
jgi:hypothetical protein